MKLQLDIGSEVAVCLISMPMYEQSKKQIAEAVEKTSIWLKGARKLMILYKKISQKTKSNYYLDNSRRDLYRLRKKSTNDLLKLNFDGYSIGGFGLGETIKEEFKIVEQIKKILPQEKPIYLMELETHGDIKGNRKRSRYF
jgi:queuine tRNA-ribosyltransferase